MEKFSELEEIAKNYVLKNGQISLGDIETPSFIRRRYNLIYREPEKKKISTNVPGKITKLLNELFGEEDVQFA
ncbi:MAG: hypothetical protein ABFR75_00145 [Acidobacteriota bacterium]